MKNEKDFKMSFDLLGRATFSYTDDNDITHTVTTETEDDSLQYFESRDSNIFRQENFADIRALMLFFRAEGIDTEDFEQIKD